MTTLILVLTVIFLYILAGVLIYFVIKHYKTSLKQETTKTTETTNELLHQPTRDFSPQITDFQWEFNINEKYPIYINNNGRCFVYKISKANKKYRYYLDEIISKKIAERLGIKYTYKQDGGNIITSNE